MIAFALTVPSLSIAPDVLKRASGVDQVLTKNDLVRSETDQLDQLRSDVTRLVAGEEYVTGSKMVAYANVGRALKRSPSWVRKFVGRQDGVSLSFLDFVNIARAYGALCERIEAAAATERRREQELRRMADAAVEGAPGLVASPEGADRDGAPS